MSIEANNVEATTIEITQHQSFLDDPIFSEVKKSAGKRWTSVLAAKPPSSQSSAGMDTAVFHEDRFELVIDVRGYRPEDLKCVITPGSVEVSARQQQDSSTGGTQRQGNFTRNYQLHQPVRPEQGVCVLSSDGIMMIRVPWRKDG